MSDFDLRAIDGAFAEFRSEAGPMLRPEGLDPVRATIRRRRQVRTVALAVVAVVLIVLPIAAYAQVGSGRHQVTPLGPPADSARPSAVASLSGPPVISIAPSDGVIPSAPARSSTPPCATATHLNGAPGRTTPISVADLCGSTLDIPAFPDDPTCPHGPLAFVGGNTRSDRLIYLSHIASGDVDHDGVADGVAVVSCDLGQSSYDQALAFHRDGTGAIRTLGKVIGTDGTILRIHDVTVTSDGSVRARVSNISGTDGPDFWAPVIQWRTFRWSAGHFTQTAGSTSLRADPGSADLTMTTTPLVFGKPQNGIRTGRVTLTVHNRGGKAVPQVALYVLTDQGTIETACPRVTDIEVPQQTCSIGTLAAGDSRQFTVKFTRDDTQVDTRDPNANTVAVVIQLRTGDQLYSETRGLSATVQ
jgi:hypothetical protein